MPTLAAIHSFASTELGRIIATFLVLLLGLLLNRVVGKIITKRSQDAGASSSKLRYKLVWAKNGVLAAVLVLIGGIWASKIAGVALSLAAVAGAILIVSKELISCVLGYLVLTLNRPYDIGDFIEVGGVSGKVVDLDVFGTTLAETGSVRQLTGKTVLVPHSILLSNTVRNNSATGKFILDLYRIQLPFEVDVNKVETAALAAAQTVCEGWRQEAETHFLSLEQRSLLDLPSAKEKVFWESVDGKTVAIVIRFACPMDERVNTEQSIYREFYSRYGATAPLGDA